MIGAGCRGASRSALQPTPTKTIGEEYARVGQDVDVVVITRAADVTVAFRVRESADRLFRVASLLAVEPAHHVALRHSHRLYQRFGGHTRTGGRSGQKSSAIRR